MRILIVAVSAMFLCSCATVIRGAKDESQFESTPSGATVTVESVSEDKMGPFTCVAPCTMELKRKRTWKVDFELDGYKPVSALLKPKLTGEGVGSGLGNVLAGGIIGIGVDAGTGANLDLRPNPMIAQLEPVGSPNPSRVLDADPVDEGVAPADAAPESAAPADEPSTEDAAPEEAPAPLTEMSAAPDDAPDDAAVTPVRLYKPGEAAPSDEDAADLNAQQLKKIENK